jgi:hypothetical protein
VAGKRFTPSFHDELRARFYPGQMAIDEALETDSDPEDRPSTGVLVSDRTLLENVRETNAATTAARDAFVLAVWRAHDAGISNTRIAGNARMTEAGVRQILKRTRRPRELDRT